MYLNGNFKEALITLKKAFNLDEIKANYDPKFKKIYEEMLKHKGEERDVFKRRKNEEEYIPIEHFKDKRNENIAREVFDILKEIDEYYLERKREIKSIQKELTSIKAISGASKEKHLEIALNTDKVEVGGETISITLTPYQKDKYFKLFKSLMCPLKY